MTDLAFCPHCGCNLKSEEPVAIGDLYFDPYGPTIWRGSWVKLTTNESLFLGSLVAARGRWISAGTIYDRMDSNCKNIFNIVNLYALKVRRKIARELVQIVHGRGYRLNVEFAEGRLPMTELVPHSLLELHDA